MAEATQTYTLPAPVNGINLVDPIDQMEPTYALELSNIVPAGFSAFLRNGYTLNSNTGDAVNAMNMLQGMAGASGTSVIFGGSGTKLWRMDSPTATNISSGVYSNTPFNTDTFGYRTYFANGVDTLQVAQATGSAANSDFSGVTLSNLINVSSYKERLYFIEKNTLKVWYGNSQALGASALKSFDFQFAMKDGGFLVYAGSWTNTNSITTQDLFFALSSEGELLFYEGSSPDDVTTPWGLVARYKIGKPMGYKAVIRVNSDSWIITDQGIVPISALFTADGGEALAKGPGRNINPFIVQQAIQYGFSYLWKGSYWQGGRRVYITVPLSGVATTTLVYHLDGQGWTMYELGNNQAALALTVIRGMPYYGSIDGKVYLGETGQSDNGVAINWGGRLAFNFFGSRGFFKAFKDFRPLIRTTRTIQMQFGIDTDFRRSVDLSTIATTSGTFTPWGSLWGSPWSSSVEYVYDRHNLPGQGTSGALRFKGSIINSPLDIYGFEVGFKPGARV